MSPLEAAERAGIAHRTIVRWLASGRLEHRRIQHGGRVYIDITIGQLMDAERVAPCLPGRPKRKDAA